MTPQAAVLGSPIAHSLSPVIHRAAYAHLGLDWHYSRIELKSEQFEDFVDGLDDSWRGLSVTMPLKERAARCGHQDADVTLTGAANTVVMQGERRVYNTDIPGLTDALLARQRDKPLPPENPMSADRVRWEHIQRIYELCDRNVSETARRLGMHRRTLARKLEKQRVR